MWFSGQENVDGVGVVVGGGGTPFYYTASPNYLTFLYLEVMRSKNVVAFLLIQVLLLVLVCHSGPNYKYVHLWPGPEHVFTAIHGHL